MDILYIFAIDNGDYNILEKNNTEKKILKKIIIIIKHFIIWCGKGCGNIMYLVAFVHWHTEKHKYIITPSKPKPGIILI